MSKKQMEKESVYFPHFVSARNDRKIRRLRRELNVEGYGIYFMLLEVLREQSDLKYPMDDIDLLADEFGTSEQKIRVVVCNYGLFVIDDNEKFFSPNQILYLQPFFEKSNRARHAALVRWNNIDKDLDANAMQMHSTSNTFVMQGKERKGKNSKDSKEKSVELTSQVLDAREISEHLLSRIIQWQPDHKYTRNKPSTESWVQDIERAMRIDGIPKENLIAMIDYVFTRNTSVSQFWAPNIQSGAKVRKHFEAIRAQATTENKKHKNNNEKSIIDHEQLLSDVLEVSRQLQNS